MNKQEVQNDSSSNKVIDEVDYNESLSSEYSDKSFLRHMKRIIGNISSDGDSESQSVTTDPDFMEEKERAVRSMRFEKQSEEHRLTESVKDPREERTMRI